MRWYEPARQRERERAALEREATKLLVADRRRRKTASPPRAAVAVSDTSSMPRRLTFADLATLRKRGLVP
jgi:hypothetical protein